VSEIQHTHTHTHTHTQKKSHAYKQVFGKLQEMSSLGTPREILKYIIKIN